MARAEREIGEVDFMAEKTLYCSSRIQDKTRQDNSRKQEEGGDGILCSKLDWQHYSCGTMLKRACGADGEGKAGRMCHSPDLMWDDDGG